LWIPGEWSDDFLSHSMGKICRQPHSFCRRLHTGAFVTTFNGPFLSTGNGYYASWAAFFFSVVFMQQVGILQFGAQVSVSTKSSSAESQTGRLAVPVSGDNHNQHLFVNSAAV
jgi:hypothetical protein